MKIHEYQAKQLMAARGIPVPAGRVATTVDEAVAAVRPLMEDSGNPVVVLKSQIHAGGRGKGTFKEHSDVRGVNVVTEGIDGGVEAAEARIGELAEQMLGSTLVTIQTGEEGKKVSRLYVEPGVDIDRELYLAVLLDRSASRNIVMASTEGGMEIEKVAEETPELILRAEIDPAIGLAPFQANELAHGLGVEGDPAPDGAIGTTSPEPFLASPLRGGAARLFASPLEEVPSVSKAEGVKASSRPRLDPPPLPPVGTPP